MMSGDHCNREETQQRNSGSPSKCGSDASGASGSRKNPDSPVIHFVPDEMSEIPKKGFKLSRNELLDSEAFNKTIATWFGEKGFIAMRSFFRASVLNSLQKDPMGLNQTNCTDLDAVIVTLIADYLVKKGKYFTMSVFSNEVLRPLVTANPNLKQVLQRIGTCEDLGEPTLTRETVSFVLRTLDVQTHSMLGAGILQKYLEDRTDLLSLFMGLIRDNAQILNVKERPVRDDDVVAAFSEGLQEEMGKLHCWFSNFNNQFVDVSGRLRKLICPQATEDGVRSNNLLNGQDEQELWNQMVRMDEHLKKQQDCLMKMRDKERKKLATYAKELEDLHQEMNLKLKSIQDYEKTLKIREKSLRENEAIASVGHRGKGDYEMVDIWPKSGYLGEGRSTLNQRFDEQLGQHEAKSSAMTGQIMEENLELKAILREQKLRIDALTKKSALLSTGCYCDKPMTSPLPNASSRDILTSNSPCHSYGNLPSRAPTYRHEFPPLRPPNVPSQPFPGGSLVSAMSSALRRARMEIDSLRDEQNTTDLQYDRLLHNKLSKRLYSFHAGCS